MLTPTGCLGGRGETIQWYELQTIPLAYVGRPPFFAVKAVFGA
jgi:hypothetical protein